MLEATLPDSSDDGAQARPRTGPSRPGIYVASRASVPARPAMWRAFRAEGYPIVSSWIDEAGEGESASMPDLWRRIHQETRGAALVLYAPPEDAPWKGALVEVGLTLASGGRVFVAGDHKHLGSWVWGPGVTVCADVRDALDAARSWIDADRDADVDAEAASIEAGAALDAIAAIVRLGHSEHCAKRQAWGDGVCECGSADRCDAEVAQLTAQRDAYAQHYAELGQAVHDTLDAAQAPGGRPDIRIAWLSDSRRRADDALSTLRRAIADVVDIDGSLPSDDDLVRRLRELGTSDERDLAVARDVIGTCTASIRKLACEGQENTTVIAVTGLCTVIERVAGVRT